MSRRRLRIIDRGATFVIRGWRGGDLAAEANIRVVWTGVSQGWVGQAKDLADLVAYLEYRNVGLVVEPEGGEAA